MLNYIFLFLSINYMSPKPTIHQSEHICPSVVFPAEDVAHLFSFYFFKGCSHLSFQMDAAVEQMVDLLGFQLHINTHLVP